MFHPFLAFVFTAGRGTTVPYPNNLFYPVGGGPGSPDVPTFFIEFPSFPRMSLNEYNIASRGNHPPVLEYTLDGEDTLRSGNTGLYFNLKADEDIVVSPPDTSSNLLTAVAKLGNVPEFSVYQVPGLGTDLDGTVFDVFPGSPAIQDDGIIAFKGNYAKPVEATDIATDEAVTVLVSQTGVFYRQLTQGDGGGDGNLYVVANSQTLIPEPNVKCKSTLFGSTAAPSVVDTNMVFRGLDDEDDPGCGGLYLAKMDPETGPNYPDLTALVTIETEVPGEDAGVTFTNFGEGKLTGRSLLYVYES